MHRLRDELDSAVYIASLCARLRLIRRRAVPSGTVGGRIAPTKISCSLKRCAMHDLLIFSNNNRNDLAFRLRVFNPFRVEQHETD